MKKYWTSEVQIAVVAAVFFSIITMPHTEWWGFLTGPALVVVFMCVYYPLASLVRAIKRLSVRA